MNHREYHPPETQLLVWFVQRIRMQIAGELDLRTVSENTHSHSFRRRNKPIRIIIGIYARIVQTSSTGGFPQSHCVASSYESLGYALCSVILSAKEYVAAVSTEEST